jgi:hypothetical protein
MDARIFIGFVPGLRRIAAGLVHPLVAVAAFDRVGRIRPFALYPFEVGQARAIGILVDHAGRQQGDAGGQGWGVEGQGGLRRGLADRRRGRLLWVAHVQTSSD